MHTIRAQRKKSTSTENVYKYGLYCQEIQETLVRKIDDVIDKCAPRKGGPSYFCRREKRETA